MGKSLDFSLKLKCLSRLFLNQFSIKNFNIEENSDLVKVKFVAGFVYKNTFENLKSEVKRRVFDLIYTNYVITRDQFPSKNEPEDFRNLNSFKIYLQIHVKLDKRIDRYLEKYLAYFHFQRLKKKYLKALMSE